MGVSLRQIGRAFFVLLLLSLSTLSIIDPASAADASVPLFTAVPTAGGQVYGVSAASLPYLILFPFLPALLLSFSAFTRIAVVLFLLRQGLGSPSVPPNLVLVGLAVLLTYFVMGPVLDKIQVEAYAPFSAGQMPLNEARDRAALPLKIFMLRRAVCCIVCCACCAQVFLPKQPPHLQTQPPTSLTV